MKKEKLAGIMPKDDRLGIKPPVKSPKLPPEMEKKKKIIEKIVKH